MSSCITWRGAKALVSSFFIFLWGDLICHIFVFEFGAGGGSDNCANHWDEHNAPEVPRNAQVGGMDGKFVKRVGRHGFCRAFCDDSPSAYMLNKP